MRVLRRPLVTEKMSALAEETLVVRQYAFEVEPDANKIQIRNAVEKKFEVKVTSIRTITIRGKMRRYGRFLGKRPDWKKAIITLEKGQTIGLFEHA
ncbi:MAG: 50S ribosomal protein L23 [bacterium]|nr:50S ribosomal protein L23 [bacterium]